MFIGYIQGSTVVGLVTVAYSFRGLVFYNNIHDTRLGKSYDNRVYILGTIAELRKATSSFVMSICPSAWNNSAPNGRILMKFDT
jgi:hypothetical protein